MTGHVMSLMRVIGRVNSCMTRGSVVRRSRRVIAFASGHAADCLEREAQGQQDSQQDAKQWHSISLN